jgi:hypothetical protein
MRRKTIELAAAPTEVWIKSPTLRALEEVALTH